MKHFRVHVTSKEGVFDPAGNAATEKLSELGFQGVQKVAVGKYIQITTEESVSAEQVEEMCEKLLVNPVIEDFTIIEEA